MGKFYDASLEGRIKRAVALLDEERAFWWEPGSYPQAILDKRADDFERSHRERMAEDHWMDIDKRMAEAFYETMTFADYISAPWQYPEEEEDGTDE